MKLARIKLARRAPARAYLHRFDPARYPPAYLRSGILEAQVQAACVAYLRARWRARVTEVDVGDRHLRGRAAALLRAAGGDPRRLTGAPGQMRSGIVDLAVTFPHLGGRAAWFEVKKPARLAPSQNGTGRLVVADEAGVPTDEQLAFLDEQARAGALVGVLWAPKDLDVAVDGHAVGAGWDEVDLEVLPAHGGKDLSMGPG